MGTGVALELWHAGLHRLVLLECARPRAIRRLVVFSEAVFEGKARVEGLEARLCPDTAACRALWQTGEALPLLVDEDGASLRELCPQVFVDATMSKKARCLSPNMADLVIALGPGIEAGRDVPCEHGRSEQRVGRAPCAGVFASPLPLGSHVLQGQEVGRVDGVPVPAPLSGRLRGLLRSGLPVRAGAKVCDIEPLDHVPLDKVSSRARCLGRGVLRALAARYNLPT